MITDYSCPLCKTKKWKSVQNYIYKTRNFSSFSIPYQDKFINYFNGFHGFLRAFLYAAPKPKDITEKMLTSYARLRRRILFEIWFPKEKEVIITSQYCLNCGFMAYTPRPTNADLRAKYEFLGKIYPPDEREKYTSFLEKDTYFNREKKIIYELITNEVSGKKLKILDFGGGFGWFSLPFLAHGHDCSLVDYADMQLPGIKKIANEINELPSDISFDAIICRATLEHVADPLSVVEKFHYILKDNGVVYAMVPDEIMGGITRLGTDPVTHINFFTPQSFKLLFKLANFKIACSDTDEMNNTWLLAKKASNNDTVTISNELLDIERLLKPDRFYCFNKVILNRFRRIRLYYFH